MVPTFPTTTTANPAPAQEEDRGNTGMGKGRWVGMNRKQTSYVTSHIFTKALLTDKLYP